jgi:4-diphosphocytidyl-2-C-methyl-D-erythritol kinase
VAHVVVRANAKVNLYLHILGRRPDGFHRLDSLVVFAAAHDRIEVSADRGLTLEIEGPFADALRRADAAGERNSVGRAARALAAAAGRTPEARIRLFKNLPIDAGLGGGSADAAAALRALVECWQLDRRILDDAGLALSLGADVPVCLHGRSAFVGGIGESIVPSPALPTFALLLAFPATGASTAEVFRGLEPPYGSDGRFSMPPPTADDLARILSSRRNDLTESTVGLVPDVAPALAAVAALPACRLARMTGSGTTIFGIFDDAPTAARAADDLRRQHGRWWVWSGELAPPPTPTSAVNG